ncbi:MAG TPA: response regulator [Vicinamibacterales bacterium]|jgi:CheY-like chemotaxis protein
MTHRVLIVDDDEQVRGLLRRFLEPEGYEVIEAASAEEAVERVEWALPSVALCDVHMSGANGLWLADQIRALSPATAMVLATGDAKVPPAETLRSGIVGYLLKPLRRERVVAAVSEGVRWSAEAVTRGAQRRPRHQLPEGMD